jgi:serine O-acetyltransferase
MNPFSSRLLASIRAYQYHRDRSGPWHILMRRIARIRHILWSVVTQSDVDLQATLGKGLMLPHPNGVVIHGEARIGDDCMIMQQVTVGMIDEGEVPVIGNRVYIGAGAKIIGKLTVGDGARIGANAVVVNDVPSNATAVGIPARIIRRASAKPAKSLAG